MTELDAQLTWCATNITFSAQHKWHFWNENEKQNKNENSFSAENGKSRKWPNSLLSAPKTNFVRLLVWWLDVTWVTRSLRFYDKSTPLPTSTANQSSVVALTFWPWKWCPSHVWRGLPLCQFWSWLSLRPDVRDRQTDVIQHHRLMPRLGVWHNNNTPGTGKVETAQCNLCTKQNKYSNNTKNLWQHLERHHKNAYKKLMDMEKAHQQAEFWVKGKAKDLRKSQKSSRWKLM